MGVQMMRKLYRIMQSEPLDLSLKNYPISPGADLDRLRRLVAKELVVLRDNGIIEIKEGSASLLASEEKFEKFLETYKIHLGSGGKRKRKHAIKGAYPREYDIGDDWRYGDVGEDGRRTGTFLPFGQKYS